MREEIDVLPLYNIAEYCIVEYVDGHRHGYCVRYGRVGNVVREADYLRGKPQFRYRLVPP